MPKRLLVIVFALLLTSGCAVRVNGVPVAGVAASTTATTSRGASTTGSPSPAGQCEYAKDTSPGALPSNGFPDSKPGTGKTTATFTTDKGTLTIDLDPTAGPCSVEAIRYLVKKKFYDGTSCHRLTTNPSLGVLQCGDPSGTGTGTPGFRYEDKLPTRGAYVRGVVAMANAGPGTNGSQFFIVHGAAQIDSDYPVVGKVRSGMELVDAVVAGGVEGGAQDGKPVKPMTFTSVVEG
ncbi:peptidylprolyl isomerase [Umezawaea endophytica]|uniref:Peptidyl-prolyl cis-trans isomerase n=1 Tax=Umezawaea endophytica TaxID=1654476 RepID=A0A9X2VRL0_9PSEU|nr:peptidylprolyl isomerase [Umezawaea endophytica]MCS7481346.1 peptidylprolyl isomerase [Umezawaea endophytica]